MREIKFRYIWKRKTDGHIWIEIVPIECLENRGDKPFVHTNILNEWTLISRDMYTNLKDKNNKNIYKNDILNIGEKGHASPELVVFNKGCWGIYASWIKKKNKFIPLFNYCNSVFIGCVELIGNKWVNPELLEKING